MHLFEKRERFRSRGLWLSILAFGLIAVIFFMMLGQVSTRASDHQTSILEDALRRAAITCFAIEGHYPPSLQYLIEHYGVIIDDEKYIVSYDVFASNIMPNIRVLLIGEGSEGEVWG